MKPRSKHRAVPAAVRPVLRHATALLAAIAIAWPGSARPQDGGVDVPAFRELEAAGATIGEIRIIALDVFDTEDPREDKLLFRWANRLHIQTRPEVIERALLFKRGEPVSVRLIEETERILRSNRYLYDVQLRPVAVHDGVVDIEVRTRDTWSLDPGLSAGRSGGSNSSSVGLKEYNLLGTGVGLSLGHSRNVDRSGNEFSLVNTRAFGSWTSIGLSHASNSDGRRDAVSVVRPFYALDARWAAGVTAVRDDRLDSIYRAGEMTAQYRHRETRAEIFGGGSAGLVDGWAQRYSLGLALQRDEYALEPGATPPPVLPADQKLVSPFVRYELVEDRYERELNRNLIGRPEFFALGLASTVQLGWATPKLGSTQEGLLYNATLSHGFEPWADHTLIAAARLNGQFTEGQVRRQRFGLQAQYYLPQGPRWLFFAGASADVLSHPNPEDALLLGGDNGLRGYPLRYQSGTRRALFTAEERFYTDLYLWRLFRIGGAAFVDVGRAWGGAEPGNPGNPGWLSDVGMGLRIVSARSAFSNVLHVDIAAPLNTTPDIKRVQFLVKTKTSF